MKFLFYLAPTFAIYRKALWLCWLFVDCYSITSLDLPYPWIVRLILYFLKEASLVFYKELVLQQVWRFLWYPFFFFNLLLTWLLLREHCTYYQLLSTFPSFYFIFLCFFRVPLFLLIWVCSPVGQYYNLHW